MFALLFILLASARAEVACSWSTAPAVSATMTTVTVDGEVVQVRGRAHREAFEARLVACGELEAASAFRSWRATRRTINILVPVTLLTIPIVAVVPAAMTIDAGRAKRRLVRELEAP